MSKFNGHKNWNHWNVSLWLNNDEPLWREMVHFVQYAPTRLEAAKMMHTWLHQNDHFLTPDGAPYSVSSIRAAMVGITK